MELKVACYCGQKYKFDVEPVDGRMPFTVNCPVCGVDGTPLANHLLTQQVSVPAPVRSPVPAVAPMPLPPAPTPMTAPMTAPAPSTASGLKINRPPPVAAPPSLAASSAPPPVLAGTTPAPLSSARPIAPIKPLPMAQAKNSGEYNLGRGILGAFLGAAIGGILVYSFFAWLGFRFPLTGTVTGLLAGFGAKLLARGTDNTLGFFAGAFTLVSIGGVFLLIFFQFDVFYIGAVISAVVGVSFAFRIASG